MKNTNLSQAFLTGVATLGLCGAALAGSTFAVDNVYSGKGAHVTTGSPLDDSFDLLTAGFVVGTDTVTSGTVTFDLSQPNSSGVKVGIDLGSFVETSGGTIGSHGSDTYTFTFNSSNPTILADINADGILEYALTADNGNYYLTEADLCINYTVNTVQPIDDAGPPLVPDTGSTMTLLGFGLMGISAAARKFRLGR